jgi:hypothetical protein
MPPAAGAPTPPETVSEAPVRRTNGRPQPTRATLRPAPPARANGRPAPASRPAAGSRTAQPGRPAPPRSAAGGVPGRRTVTIRGHGAERDLLWASQQSRRRPSRRPHERTTFKPDRAAMWAVLLGLLLVLVAATSSHAAVLSHALH